MEANPDLSLKLCQNAGNSFFYQYRSPSEKTLSSPSHRCTSCGLSLTWDGVDLTHGIALCRICARRRRLSNPVGNGLELATRLATIKIQVKDEIRTALELLKGTPQENESKIWGNLILAALDSPGMGVPARTMATTIANVRRPYFMAGEPQDGGE